MGCVRLRLLLRRSSYRVRLIASVSAPSEAWRFLWGGSPHRGRSHHPPVPRVASGEEAGEPNEPGEASTGYHVDRRGDRTSQSLIPPRQGNTANGDGFHAPEASTEEACWCASRGSAGVHLSAWEAWREASGTWETRVIPDAVRYAQPTTRRTAKAGAGVGSPHRTWRAGEPLTGGRG